MLSHSISASHIQMNSEADESSIVNKEQNIRKLDPENAINDDEEINLLLMKIQQKEKQYSQIEAYYSKKIKELSDGLYQENQKYIELSKRFQWLKQMSEEHKIRVEQLNQNGDTTDRTVKSPQRHANYSPKNMFRKPKSPNQSNPQPLKSPPIKANSPPRDFKKFPVLNKASINSNDSIKAKDNILADRILKRSSDKNQPMSPMTKQNRNLKNSSPTDIGMKKSKGLGALKERAPFK